MRFITVIVLMLVFSNIFGQDSFKTGDRVQVNWEEKGYYYKGFIDEIKDGLYFIKYDDGGTEWAKPTQIKLDVFEWPANSCADKTSKFKVNDKVDVESSGIWYDATVLKVQDGQYFIHYDGWSSSYDEVVNNDRIRAFTKKAMATSQENMSGGSSASGGYSGSSNDGAQTISFKIQNTCLHDAVMIVGDKEYLIKRNSSITIEAEVGAFVYAVSSTRKVLKGSVSVNDYMNNFTPVCD